MPNIETSIPKEQWGTHQNHCCKQHGCKYGYEDCPVVLGLIKQQYPCEHCSPTEDIIDSMLPTCFYPKIKDWEEPIDFENTERCHDWRNYAMIFKDIWNDLTIREKKIIYIYASSLADKEEWD